MGAFPQRVLPQGATTAAIRYNFFARAIAVLINLTIVIPALNYFADFGALAPGSIEDAPLRCVEGFGSIIGAPMKLMKSQWRNAITFLGLGVISRPIRRYAP